MALVLLLFQQRRLFMSKAFSTILLLTTRVITQQQSSVELHPKDALLNGTVESESFSKSFDVTQLQQVDIRGSAWMNASQHKSGEGNYHTKPTSSLPTPLSFPLTNDRRDVNADPSFRSGNVDNEDWLEETDKQNAAEGSPPSLQRATDGVRSAPVKSDDSRQFFDEMNRDEPNDTANESLAIQRQHLLDLHLQLEAEEEEEKLHFNGSQLQLDVLDSSSSSYSSTSSSYESLYPDPDDDTEEEEDADEDYFSDASDGNRTTTAQVEEEETEASPPPQPPSEKSEPEGREVAYETYDVLNEQMYELDADDAGIEVVREIRIRSPELRHKKKRKTKKRNEKGRPPNEPLSLPTRPYRRTRRTKNEKTAMRKQRSPRLTQVKGVRQGNRRAVAAASRLPHSTSPHRRHRYTENSPVLFYETRPIETQFGSVQAIAVPNNYDTREMLIWPGTHQFYGLQQEMPIYQTLHSIQQTAADPRSFLPPFGRSRANTDQIATYSSGHQISSSPSQIYRSEEQIPVGNYGYQTAAAAAAALPRQIYEGQRTAAMDAKSNVPVIGRMRDSWNAEQTGLEMAQRNIEQQNTLRYGNEQMAHFQRSDSARGKEALTTKFSASSATNSAPSRDFNSSRRSGLYTAMEEGTLTIAAGGDAFQQQQMVKEEEKGYYRPRWVMMFQGDMQPDYEWYSDEKGLVLQPRSPLFHPLYDANHDVIYNRASPLRSEVQLVSESLAPSEDSVETKFGGIRRRRRRLLRPLADRGERTKGDWRRLPDAGERQPSQSRSIRSQGVQSIGRSAEMKRSNSRTAQGHKGSVKSSHD